MINYLKKVYKNILQYFSSERKNSTETDKYIGAITFKLTKDKIVDISCYIPEVKDISVNKLTKLSEEYAQLLVSINDGLLASKIVDLINDLMEESETDQEKLFMENILVFWSLLHVEHLKNKKNKSSQPLIRPISVFAPND